MMRKGGIAISPQRHVLTLEIMHRPKRASCIAIFAMSILGCSEPARELQAPHQQQAVEQPQSMQAVEGSSSGPAASSERTPPSEPSKLVYGDQFPQVLAVMAKASQGNRRRFDVTLSSPYDSPQRYADAWRVLDEQDNELGIRILGHDHASEQPFTRSHVIEVPDSFTTVFVEARDQANGWSGQRFEVDLP